LGPNGSLEERLLQHEALLDKRMLTSLTFQNNKAEPEMDF
jgi:hypothetical protein